MKYIRLFGLCVFILLLASCNDSNHLPKTPPEPSMGVIGNGQKNPPPEKKLPIIPLVLEDGEFNQVHDWMETNKIIYSYTKGSTYYLATFDVYTEATELLYTSENPIVSVIVHPERKKLLVQTAPLTYQASITIMDTNGNILTEQDIASSEVSIEWNPTNDNYLLITAFNEDWSYEVYHLQVQNKQLEKHNHLQPFYKWFNSDNVLEQKWGEGIALFAPLWKTNIEDKEQSESFFPSVYYYDWLAQTYLFTITVPESDETTFQYRFYTDENSNPMYQLDMPNLTQFTDWIVPFYTFTEQDEMFYTFVPEHHGIIDTYGGTFALKQYDLEQQIEKTLFDSLENKPISCDGTSNLCLYGYQFEQIIDLEELNITSLISKMEE